MMDSATLIEKIDHLDDSLEELEEVLKPILDESLYAATKKLPLLDRAKLNVTVVYAIESLLFSYLRVNGADAKEHAVFKELTRVRSYFDKVKEADEKQKKPTLVLDKQASRRIILNSLAGNISTTERENKLKLLKEQIMAKRKSASSPHTPVSLQANLDSPPEPFEATELLESISKEIEMHDHDQDQEEGSEEGEIEDSTPYQHPLPVKSPFESPQLQLAPQVKKRKHDHAHNGKTSTSKAAKKNRKKSKSKNAN